MSDLERAIERQPQLPRFLCHLYQRLTQRRLNIVTGAGISIDAKVPSWQCLLDRLASRLHRAGAELGEYRNAGLTPEYLGQLIYHRHRAASSHISDGLRDARINHDWAECIYDELYKSVPKTIAEIIAGHPYLDVLCGLVRKVPLVINFNFDDILAEAIGQQTSHNSDSHDLPPTVVWQPHFLDRPGHTTIYHVNGVLPRIRLKSRSTQLTFTEDSFADAIARAPGMTAELILVRFVQNTMLIMGHSLADASLKNYLRQNRDNAPANHHYMISWLNKPDALSKDQIAEIFEANLELYNVITMFLTSNEIKEVVSLLTSSDRDFKDAMLRINEDRLAQYRYYIVGPVAAGKTLLLEQLRCFETYEEWTRPPPPEMYVDFKKLTPEESSEVDKFVYSELRQKNRLMREDRVGLRFMDRAPLDLYAFSKNDDERGLKTKAIETNVVTPDTPLQSGQIIFLSASGDILVERNLGRGRPPEQSGDANYLEQQMGMLMDIYHPQLIVSTNGRSPDQIGKEVARRTLLNKYEPTDLVQVMRRYTNESRPQTAGVPGGAPVQ